MESGGNPPGKEVIQLGITNSNKVINVDRIDCSGSLRVTLALTAENRSLLAKVRREEPEFTVEREELVASSPRKLFLERTNAYNERVKQQLKEKLAEKN